MIQCSMDSKQPEREARELSKVHEKHPVAMRLGETPVPIPNTMVKTQAADGTMLETAWESRWLPEHLIRTSRRRSSNLVTKGSDPEWCVTTLSESESQDEA